ncbi:hypothetical protein K2173_003348 [Erythroxylum novogranatense]|uniref:Fold protein n=1 Tax=Erythroxylum novogranatense TaxID=1862640 RepID=A0AAV8S8G2_9ROSI|nr:hypothetical protein K2173_003348 [Erythroxylum novogranatense]
MALDESMNMVSSMQDDDYDQDTDDGYDRQPHPHNLSRLSVCTSSLYTNDDDFDVEDSDVMGMSLSRLSIESFDADEELSDNEKVGKISMLDLSSESDEEPGCYSLPTTPPRRRSRRGGGLVNERLMVGLKEYASENEAQKGSVTKQKTRKNSRRRVVRERWVDNKAKRKDEECCYVGMSNYGHCNSFSGESEGGGLVVITRPKGGRRSLCMDLEEVKACRDLGFELEHERMLEMPSRVSLSGSTLDTSSGGNSPIANWRISSPGDDPRDVKARLRVWAQAVALASASKHSCVQGL